jgi:hypothetical protein
MGGCKVDDLLLQLGEGHQAMQEVSESTSEREEEQEAARLGAEQYVAL